ncbi:MAG: hypothetical protein KGJ86_13995, partial [Chloroflexota bacterium]|nr:hypothetical protein [Chloroflexota bacterium]
EAMRRIDGGDEIMQPMVKGPIRFAAEEVRITSLDDFAEVVFERGWTDGFPVFPPTRERVRTLIQYLGREPGEVVGTVTPGEGIATIEAIAVNCAMAGCKPEYMPVVMAILEALLDKRYHLLNSQASTIGGPPLIIISGPVVKKLGFNYAEGTYGGSGHRANGTVARAIRLILWNIGQGKPGEMAKAVFGTPLRWGSLIVERPRDDGNPWEEFHVTAAGLRPEDSAVSVLDGRGAYVHTPFARAGSSVEPALPYIAQQLLMSDIGAGGGGTVVLAVNPDMANMVANEGWSKQRFRDALYEHCYETVGQVTEMERALGGIDANVTVKHHWSSRVVGDEKDPQARVYSVADPSHLAILVSGGVGGGHVCYFWRGGRHSSDGSGLVTKKIDWEWE